MSKIKIIVLVVVITVGAIVYMNSRKIPDYIGNPYLPEQHVPDEDGYMHDLPCHANESAHTFVCFVGGAPCEGRDGCYVWQEPKRAMPIYTIPKIIN